MINANNLFLGLAALSGSASAFFRMQCQARSGMGRIDPLVDHGEIGAHAHYIHGGNNFNFFTTPESLATSECGSCIVKQDKSAYWTPILYFCDAADKCEAVEESGGMLAYYLLYTNGADPKIQAFPPGFGMLAGDPTRRNGSVPGVYNGDKSAWPLNLDNSNDYNLKAMALGFNCLNYAGTPEPSLDRHFFPDKAFTDANCPNGVRFEIMFPSCWNGKQVNPPDHQSHMAYPNQVMSGTCPDAFPHKMPSLFFETIFNTQDFVGRSGRFVLSNGDPTGFGYHADFMMGWDPDFLQQAVDTCTNLSGEVQDCPIFDLQDVPEASQCTFPIPEQIKSDNLLGPRAGLPGNVAIEPGPAPASLDLPIPLKGGINVLKNHAEPTKAPVHHKGGHVNVAAEVPAPAVTEAPAPVPAVDGRYSTMWSTEGNSVWKILVEIDTVTTTAAGPSPAAVKRHMHEHHRHHRAAHLA